MLGRALPTAILAVAVLAAEVATARGSDIAERYARAERFLPWNRPGLAYNEDVVFGWSRDGRRLWRRSEGPEGWRYLVLDVARRTEADAFDHGRMAAALSAALGRPVQGERLPIERLVLEAAADAPQVVVGRAAYACDLAALVCRTASAARRPDWAYSADGRYAVSSDGANLWLEDLSTGARRPLTSDGGAGVIYGGAPGTDEVVSQARKGVRRPPFVEFSPDGRRILTQRIDERAVPPLHLMQSAPEPAGRPRLWRYRRPLPGDPAPVAELVVFDIGSGAATRLAHPMRAQLGGPLALEQAGWSADSLAVLFIDYADEYRELSLWRADAVTGAATRLIRERSATNTLAMGHPRRAVLASGEIIWPSERSGVMQLYLHDAQGRLRRQLTSGAGVVRELVDLDEAGRTILFTAASDDGSRDPYLRQVWRANLDRGPPRRLTSEDADHQVAVSSRRWLRLDASRNAGGVAPDHKHFVDAWSRPDLPTMTVLRDLRGAVVMRLETARLADGVRWRPPEMFRAVAADGATPIFGAVFTPSDLDPSQRYPVVDLMYPGPQTIQVGKRFLTDVITMSHAQSIAELGFIVVAVDGRGTPLRSKAFRDLSYGRLGTAGYLEDHVAALRQLAAARPYMDLGRVAAVGHSGGGFAAVHALVDHPDVFKAAAASSGVHDLSLYSRDWGAKYQGPFDAASYAAQSVFDCVDRIRGPLLLSTGDMDDNVHPANTFKLADALVRANKDFELVVVPNAGHDVVDHPYLIRRTWDFLVRVLRGEAPPAGYRIAPRPE